MRMWLSRPVVTFPLVSHWPCHWPDVVSLVFRRKPLRRCKSSMSPEGTGTQCILVRIVSPCRHPGNVSSQRFGFDFERDCLLPTDPRKTLHELFLNGLKLCVFSFTVIDQCDSSRRSSHSRIPTPHPGRTGVQKGRIPAHSVPGHGVSSAIDTVVVSSSRRPSLSKF